jgi:Asp-tRNA(Asn)/Glu-tRNA(Gln) amidotransferase A subunit family amidase
MFQISRSLDHVGLFARTLEDLALLLENVAGYDERDPDTRLRPRVAYRAIAAEAPPLAPMFAFVKTPRWGQVEPDAREALGELIEHLGDRVEEIDLFEGEAADWHRTIMDAELAVNLAREWRTGRDRLSASLRDRIEHGQEVRAPDYLQALAQVPRLTAGYTELFEQRYDAIVTPAAAGTAPLGLDSTGDPAFNMLWTLCGMPAVTVPLMRGANGLPLGVQLVGPRHGDARLLRTARWLVETISAG